MGRKPRVHFAGAVYHVVSRGVERRVIFYDDADRRAFINAMHRCVGRTGATLLAYCLMGNHFHLAIQVGETPLSSIMQRLLTGYCMYFNARHDRKGHLFEARHSANICLDDRYLAALIRYIHMNPVRAGLVAKPQDWPWSSYDERNDSGVDLSGFDPWRQPAAEHAGGLLRKDAGISRPIIEIGQDVSLRTGISVELIRSGSRQRPVVAARTMITREAVQNGHPLGRVADWLHVSACTMTRYFLKSYAENERPDTIVNAKNGRPDAINR